VSAVPARLEAIWLKRVHRGVMDPVPHALLVPDRGLEGSVDRSKRRQVTVLGAEGWQAATEELGIAVDPIARRANLLIRGLQLANTRGRILTIGEARLLVGGEVKPCERMDEAQAGLQAALRADWRGGVFTQVLTGGTIRVGDTVQWEEVDETRVKGEG
jgi:MOSC domain-containing protein YiiM